MNLKTFLFGGEHNLDGDPYRRIAIDEIHALTRPDEYPHVFESFESFKEEVEACMELGWCEEHAIPGCHCDKNSTDFVMPHDEVIKGWYTKILDGGFDE